MRPYGMRCIEDALSPCQSGLHYALGKNRARAESKREVEAQLADAAPVFEMDEWCQCPLCDERHCAECGACLECEGCGPVLCCGCDPPVLAVRA